MIEIEYTLDNIEGEPGPNCYWMGKPEDYLNLLIDLYPLATKVNSTVELNKLAYLKVQDNFEVIVKSSGKGNVLFKKTPNGFVIDLEPKYWQMILHKILSIACEPSHAYIDIEDMEVVEEANLIFSSETL